MRGYFEISLTQTDESRKAEEHHVPNSKTESVEGGLFEPRIVLIVGISVERRHGVGENQPLMFAIHSRECLSEERAG